MALAQKIPPEPRPPAAETVYFGIPLKARRTARNWDWTVRDFNRTLVSIYNQTNPNFRILVGCHEQPGVLIPVDERLEFLQLDAPPPDPGAEVTRFFHDRKSKLWLAGQRMKSLGGRWFMSVDADDLISSRLVEFVLNNQNAFGYIAAHGYLLDAQTMTIRQVPDDKVFRLPLHQFTGSCAAVKFDPCDISDKSTIDYGSRFMHYQGDHRTYFKHSVDEGRPLEPFPFPAIIYVLNTGENVSFNYMDHRDMLIKRLMPALRMHGSAPDSDLTKDFALDHPLWRGLGGSVDADAPPATGEDGFRIDFVGCGAMKSGTTSLASYLRLHPAIGMGIQKELHYFDRDRNFPPAGPNYARYHDQFPRRQGANIYGEVTPAYMYLPKAMERIHAYNPRIRIVCVLRNPIERAFSHWNLEIRNGHESLPFHEALKYEAQRHRGSAPRRNQRFAYVDRGFYTEQIRHIWRLFPPEQTLFIKSDALHQDSEETMASVFAFLGMEPIRLRRTITRNNGGYEGEPSAKERASLLHIFEHEIRALERMLGWDCSSWLE